MQRGCVSTLAASAKVARERSPESEIEAKSDADRKPVLATGVCAELETGPSSATQQSKLRNDIGRMMPGPLIGITTYPGCKSSFESARSVRERDLGLRGRSDGGACRDLTQSLVPAPVAS